MPTMAEMTVEDRRDAMQRAGIWTPEQSARYDALRRSTYVLVRIDGEGERWRCGLCNGRHTHFTKLCVPLPFRGLLDGLHALYANVGGARESDLSPTQKAQLDALRPIFGGSPVPLATGHPSTAAALGTEDRDVLVGAAVLGSIDPISRAKAELYASTINFKARARIVTL